MHSNVTIKNVSWPHFSWPILYVADAVSHCVNNMLKFIWKTTRIPLGRAVHHSTLFHQSLWYLTHSGLPKFFAGLRKKLWTKSVSCTL